MMDIWNPDAHHIKSSQRIKLITNLIQHNKQPNKQSFLIIKGNTPSIWKGLTIHALEALVSQFSLFSSLPLFKIITDFGIRAGTIRITPEVILITGLSKKAQWKNTPKGCSTLLASTNLISGLILLLSLFNECHYELCIWSKLLNVY